MPVHTAAILDPERKTALDEVLAALELTAGLLPTFA
jgi:hypothetical protein